MLNNLAKMFLSAIAIFPSVSELLRLTLIINMFFVLGVSVCALIRQFPGLWNRVREFLTGRPVQVPQVQQNLHYRSQLAYNNSNMPFLLSVGDHSEGVQLTIQSRVDYRLLAYWYVSTRATHMTLVQPIRDIYQMIDEETLLLGFYTQTALNSRETAHEERQFVINNQNLVQGPGPRDYYPLVLFLFQDVNLDSVGPRDIVGLIFLVNVHVPDALSTVKTTVLYRYIKLADSTVFFLQNIYCDYNVDENRPGVRLCIVCNVYPVSRVLLPCRHTCICHDCFDRVERCPLCRSVITAFFRVGEEITPSEQGIPHAWLQYFVMWTMNNILRLWTILTILGFGSY